MAAVLERSTGRCLGAIFAPVYRTRVRRSKRARREFMVGLTTRLMTLLTGTLVGRDDEGNAYYNAKARPGRTVERRWVIYKGDVDASRVPPHWHAWLHHLADQPPLEPPAAYDWQAAHKRNLTGTPEAYRPKGSPRNEGKRAATTSDYEPWTPN